jgi:hypothetical protein
MVHIGSLRSVSELIRRTVSELIRRRSSRDVLAGVVGAVVVRAR